MDVACCSTSLWLVNNVTCLRSLPICLLNTATAVDRTAAPGRDLCCMLPAVRGCVFPQHRTVGFLLSFKLRGFCRGGAERRRARPAGCTLPALPRIKRWRAPAAALCCCRTPAYAGILSAGAAYRAACGVSRLTRSQRRMPSFWNSE